MQNEINSGTLSTDLSTKKIISLLQNNVVTILFLVVVTFGIFATANFSPSSFTNEITSRFFRNGLLVLSLIIPVMAGLGLNFGIVVGALAGMLAIIFVRYHEIPGIGGLMLCFLLSTPVAVLFGFLTGKLYNKTKGQEMISSLIVGFFAQGLYLIIVLYVIGGIIPVAQNHPMILPTTGDRPVGVRSSFDMGLPLSEMRVIPEGTRDGMSRSLDGLWRVNIMHALIAFAAIMLIILITRRFFFIKNQAAIKTPAWMFFLRCAFYTALLGFGIYGSVSPGREISRLQQIPAITGLVILAVCLFITYFTKTKLGQDCRSVGQSQHIANAAGINVNRTRIVATIISTVLAAWGMIIFLQSMGTVSTYNAQQNIGLFSVAALLVGGASVAKAGVRNAMLGLVLFHAMFIVSPAIGRFLSNNELVGEYVRSFMVYAVIGLSLGLHVWKNLKASQEQNKL